MSTLMHTFPLYVNQTNLIFFIFVDNPSQQIIFQLSQTDRFKNATYNFLSYFKVHSHMSCQKDFIFLTDFVNQFIDGILSYIVHRKQYYCMANRQGLKHTFSSQLKNNRYFCLKTSKPKWKKQGYSTEQIMDLKTDLKDKKQFRTKGDFALNVTTIIASINSFA